MKPNPSSASAAAVMTAAALTRAHEGMVTRTFVLSGEAAFERGTEGKGVAHDAGTGGIGLYDRQLIEDDGPGAADHQAGKNAGPAPVRIGGGRRVKKILHIDRLDALEAHLFLRADAVVEINGRSLELPARSWEEPCVRVPLSYLREGDNEVVLSHAGEGTMDVAYSARRDIVRNDPSRADRPARSFVSDNSGSTWRALDGELLVRLHLVQYAVEGYLVSPVIDLAESEPAEFGVRATVLSARLTAETKTPPGTSIVFLARSGATPVYMPAHWGEWQPVTGEIARPERYLQWKAILKTTSAGATPVVNRISVEASVVREMRPDWARSLRVVACENPTIIYTTLPFAYEDPLHPKLVALRRKYHLDDIIAGARSELETFVRLRHWVAQQWKWIPPVVDYPDWDANEILTRKYGFCVQFAIVYMQCAISLGYQTRFVFANNPGNGGHEVCEVWSNEHRKWVYMDAADDFHYVDRRTHIPMSLMETHDLILKTYFGDAPIGYAALPNEKKLVPELGICYGLEMEPTGSSPEWSKEQAVGGVYPLTRMWTMLRYLPRNNYCSVPYPAPLAQMRYWHYSDYIIWEGRQMPKGQWHFRNFTARRSDVEWTLNQVRFAAVIDEKPGVVNIQMGTVTPGFETFLVRVDGGAWRAEEERFQWRLHPAVNRLEMRVRTRAGIEGPVSVLELDAGASAAG